MVEQSSCKSNTSIIKLPHVEPFPVSCDYKIAGPGWTVIQRRIGGTEDFYRNWEEYKTGFGDLQYDYFMGLEKIHLLTQSQPHELYIQLEDFNNETRNARYTHFLIGSEEESYKLIKLGNFSGNSGDAFTQHLNMKFSTKDRLNDKGNCVAKYESGWWFQNCSFCNLNGRYTSEDVGKNGKKISWNHWHYKPLKFTQMMISPKSDN
ncbi:ficolin-1-like [Drosophila hydei]|uniref:Ficolin-1-like n=1 Tax=Drosophila hydei TaxID=7224 RepID=A0A6J2SPV8_DROHY|nr:ficolin-1-like [Drosophila hydei]